MHILITCMQILGATGSPFASAGRKCDEPRCFCELTFACSIFSSLVRFHFNLSVLSHSLEHKEWRKAVPSYNQSSSTMDFRTWSSLPRDDSLEPLPLNWEMAYTETGMVYFIE